MASAMVDRHQSPLAWPMPPHHNARPSFQYGPPSHTNPMGPDAPIPPRNEVDLTRDMLGIILEHFSQLVAQHFGRPIRLVVHGGACMLLHPGLYQLSQQQHVMSPSLPRRTTTRDVDYIHRSFVTELTSMGCPDPAAKIQECIRATARRYGLGADWMNSDADVALPMAYEPSGTIYDPIYTASIRENNIDLHTIFRSLNGMLTLISVTPFWSVSLKLVRYTKWDPGDICLLLRNGTVLSSTRWTPDQLEKWLYDKCWPMGYRNFDAGKKAVMRTRILDAIQMLSTWSSAVQPPEKPVSAYDAMGGGDAVASEQGGRNGWGYTFGTLPNHGQPMPQGSNPHFPVPQPAPAPVSIRDSFTINHSPFTRQSREASPRSSRSRSRSRPRSRLNNGNGSQEIFIPPEADWENYNHPLSRNTSPGPIDERYENMYHPESKGHRVSLWAPRTDLYPLEAMDRSLGAMRQYNHARHSSVPVTTIQPVIPANYTRKKKEKMRKKDRKRDRQSKWAPRSGGGADSDSSSSDDEDFAQRIANGRPWHNIYAPATASQAPAMGFAPQGREQPQPQSQHVYSRPSSRNPSPNPFRHRPAPLQLTPPDPLAQHLAPQMQPPVPMSRPPRSPQPQPPQPLDPAQRAQYQFEQQQKEYQQEQQLQQQKQIQQQQQQQQQQYRYQQQQQQHHGRGSSMGLSY
ncbi:hypothetical protein B0H34DRAFT_727627 [Crassisporium funariophilum]|nr:hypothetical protein B0H34DRAFT_727627 [Crassisporium funariophilum]